MILFVQLFIPAIIALVGFFFLKDKGGKQTIDWKEFLAQMAAQLLIAGITVAIILSSNTSDVETISGYVTDKKKNKVSCEHSYDCNCREECTGSGESKSCYQVCDTCYDHSYDWDWDVYTTVGGFTISRIDSRGTRQPSRWSAVRISEPVVRHHSFTNYIKSAPDTLFRQEGYKGIAVPAYPDNIYDYWHINRFVGDAPVRNAKAWNNDLMKINADIGAKKQVNMIIVTTTKGHDFYFALKQAWLGGKKNDVVLVLGLQGEEIAWADALAWSQDESIKVELREAMMEIGVMDRTKVISAFKANVLNHYKRKPMKDFEYLKSSITPTTTQWIVSLVIGIIVSVGLTILFHIYDPFEPNRRFGYRSRLYRRRY